MIMTFEHASILDLPEGSCIYLYLIPVAWGLPRFFFFNVSDQINHTRAVSPSLPFLIQLFSFQNFLNLPPMFQFPVRTEKNLLIFTYHPQPRVKMADNISGGEPKN